MSAAGGAGVLIVAIVVSLSKGLVVAVTANGILILVGGNVHLLVILHSICHPKIPKTPPPYTPPQQHILSIIHPIDTANYLLSVVS